MTTRPLPVLLTVALVLCATPASADEPSRNPSDPDYVDNWGQLPPEVEMGAFPAEPPPPPQQRADGRVCSYTLQSYDRSTGDAVYLESCTGGVGGGDISKLWTNPRPSQEQIDAYRDRLRREAAGNQ